MHLNIDEMHDPVGNASVDLHILKLSSISLGQDQWIGVWIVKSTEHNRFSLRQTFIFIYSFTLTAGDVHEECVWIEDNRMHFLL